MRRIFTLLTLILGLAVQVQAQETETVQLNLDNIQAAYMSNYNMDENYGQWTLMMGYGNDLVLSVDIDNKSTKRLAQQYSFTDGTITTATCYADEVDNEVFLEDGQFELSFVTKDPATHTSIYHIQGQFEGANGVVYTLDNNVSVIAFDYLYYLYFEQGVVTWDQCLIALQDAPDYESGFEYDLPLLGGNWEFYDYMGALKITAEDEDGHYLQLILDADDVQPGTYQLSDFYATFCYLANLNSGQYEAYFSNGSVTLTEIAENVFALEGRIKDKNDDIYNLTIPVLLQGEEDWRAYVASGITAPTLAAAQRVKTLRGGHIVISRDGKNYNTAGVIQR